MSTILSEPIAIIGSGISGLTAAISLARNGIKSVVYEKNKKISEEGSGTTISKNALDLLEQLNILEDLKKVSYQTDKISIKSQSRVISELNPYIIYTTRQKIVETLAIHYLKLGGKIKFNFNLLNFDAKDKKLYFDNSESVSASHVLGCDGINSKIRESFFTNNEKPIYSGFNAWRGFTDSNGSKNAEMHYGSNAHFVTYPINNSLDRCFIGISKSKDKFDESWLKKGKIDEALTSFKKFDSSVTSLINNAKDLYKWGIFTRPPLNKMYSKNLTLLGDAAHPMVPFLGQGGCLAIEDGYTFGTLLKKTDFNIIKTQIIYDQLRRKRSNIIQNLSRRVAFINHLSNPIMINSRNLLMKYSCITQLSQKKLHSYNVDQSIKNILK